MTSEILLSIITPVFNGQKYIADTIDSVLRVETSIPFEYIIVDDGSTDDSAKIVREYGAKVRYIYQVNQGEAAAVNEGIRNSSGKYCMVVSDDDPVFKSELFAKSVLFLEENPSIVATYPDWRVIDEFGDEIEKRTTREFSIRELAGLFNCLPGPGACFRKDAAVRIGGRSSKYKYVTDYDFWLRLSETGDFARLQGFMAQWRIHNESTSISSQGKDMAGERIKVIEDYLTRNAPKPDFARMALSHALYYAARIGVTSREVPARRYLFKAFLIARRWPKRCNFFVVLFILLTPFSRYLYLFLRNKHHKLCRLI
ncbi:WcaA Glycosyltransferases involved in cell wall biogenesis [Candidatus Nanopelagicaceae bacterium]